MSARVGVGGVGVGGVGVGGVGGGVGVGVGVGGVGVSRVGVGQRWCCVGSGGVCASVDAGECWDWFCAGVDADDDVSVSVCWCY